MQEKQKALHLGSSLAISELFHSFWEAGGQVLHLTLLPLPSKHTTHCSLLFWEVALCSLNHSTTGGDHAKGIKV